MSLEESQADRPPAELILLIDNDRDLSEQVMSYLDQYSIGVHAVANGNDALGYLDEADPDLVVLDLALVGEDGLAILQEIRSRSSVPVILTSRRENEEDGVRGIEHGADTYIAKPYHVRELLARARAVLRRQAIGHQMRSLHPDQGGYRFNGWQLEQRGRRLTNPNGRVVTLGESEYDLLVAFLEAPKKVLTREALRNARRERTNISDRSIDVQVMRLRRRLSLNNNTPQAIRTKRGSGYVFTMKVTVF